jgi:hypothetical protein
MVVMPAVRRTRSSRNASPVSLRLCLTNWLSDRMQLAAHSATPRNVERRRMQSAGPKDESKRLRQNVHRGKRDSVYRHNGWCLGYGLSICGLRSCRVGSARGACEVDWPAALRASRPRVSRTCDRPTTVADGGVSQCGPVLPSKRAFLAGMAFPHIEFII